MNLEDGHSLWSDAWRRLKNNKMAYISLWILIIIFAGSFLIPLIGNYFAPEDAAERAKSYWFKDPNQQDLKNKFLPISSQHWLGTDQAGRDLFSRLLLGGQVSLLVGLLATAISMIIGICYGAISGYIGGKLDTIAMRIVDILYGLPFLIIVILFSVFLKNWFDKLAPLLGKDHLNLNLSPSTTNLIINILPLCLAIGIIGWYTMARVVRSQVLATKKLEYVEAAVSLGLSHRTILFKHILPNLIGPIIIYTTLTIPGFILTESGLSFLGLGVKSPHSSWGILLQDGANYMETNPRLLLIPSIVFSITLLALSFLGDGLRDALDPKASKD